MTEDLQWEILWKVDKEVERVGYRFIAMTIPKNESDKYLRWVLARSSEKSEYVVWKYNVGGGLFGGNYYHYDESNHDEVYKIAIDKFNSLK